MAESVFLTGFETGFGSAFLTSALERFTSFGSSFWTGLGVIWGVEEELRKLLRTSLKIQDLMDFVEDNPLRFYGGSHAWKIWFEDMRKLSYDADDLQNHVSLHLSDYCARHSISASGDGEVLSMVLSSFKDLKLPHNIKEMQQKLSELANEMESLVTMERTFGAENVLGRPGRVIRLHSDALSFVGARDMIGRETDVACIQNLLDKDCFSVICIAGMAGIGKTCVARHVYDVSSNFDLRIWVSVSVDFDAVRITKSMIECAILGDQTLADSELCAGTVCASNLSSLGSLQLLLQSRLEGKRFLLVLDDYWSENCDDWDILSWPFLYGSRHSKVIVTTRSMLVSSAICSSETHKLETLSDDHCWNLIRKRSRVSINQNLENVGRKIAEKCKGVPLLATTIGNMLRCKTTEREWLLVMDNDLWEMSRHNNIFLCLLQSYLYLPAHLKKCFAYCSIFPQDYEFDVEEVSYLWVAEGFVHPVGAQRLEDIAREYLNELHLRFFFYNTSQLNIFKMHPFIHALSRMVSKDVCLHVKQDQLNSYPLFGNVCHLSVEYDGIQPLVLEASVKNERLRTFLLMRNHGSGQTSTKFQADFFKKLKFVRVLGMGDASVIDVEESIGELIYIRYLNLCGSYISSLPNSLCKLMALEMLRLKNCPNLYWLPNEMSRLTSLRHLEFDEYKIRKLPPHFRKLMKLEYISVFIVDEERGCGIDELGAVNCLRGTLSIKGLNSSTAREAREARMGLKTGLQKLDLQWRGKPQSDLGQVEVLKELEPHIGLKELVIQFYSGLDYPNWLTNSSHSFTSVSLHGLKFCHYLPALGELPFLKFFSISRMISLNLIDQRFYGTIRSVKFPSLESFELNDIPNLTYWIAASGSTMPHLNRFVLKNCPRLSSLPHNLESLRRSSNSTILHCPRLQP